MNQFHDFVVSMIGQEGLVTPEGMQRATKHAAEKQVSTLDALVALGLMSPKEIAVAHASVAEVPFADLSFYDIDYGNSALLPRSAAEKLQAFPIFNLTSAGGPIVVGMADPRDLRSVDRLRTLLRAEIEPVLCEPIQLRSMIDRAYSLGGGASDAKLASLQVSEEAAADPKSEPIIAAVNEMLAQAAELKASDVHLGPDENLLHLRYRIDGVLQPRQGPPLSSHPGLVQRIKVMANLDLTQTRRPQDGKFRFSHAGKPIDVRVSIIPTIYGENVVLRLLAQGQALGGMGDLGINGELQRQLEGVIANPHGMILVTGPTGSGKTTTLYTFLKRLNTPDRHLVTIEDPVEVRLPLIRQVQANEQIGLSFASALRSILRQDPDVILVGEIRDEETARIAVQAALTGHLVLSTLHTNDATGAVARLRDFGVPSFAINASLLGVLAQRLLRRVCVECARPYEPDASLVKRFAHALDPREPVTWRRGVGCPRCLSVGTRGRLGVYEFLSIDPVIQDAIDKSATTAAIRHIAIARGMKPLWHDALDKARLGQTTLEEVVRIAIGSLEADAAVDTHTLPALTPGSKAA